MELTRGIRPPIPDRCIWCHRTPADSIEFDDSHVLPNCVGNDKQQVLPRGLVCKPCNNYFGLKIEPVWLRDPGFHVIAVVLGLVDPDDVERFRNAIFDQEHPAVGQVNRTVSINTTLDPNRMTMDVSYGINGRLVTEYRPRDLALLSRAIHKLAFESLAWQTYVDPGTGLDLFDKRFDAIRRWGREQIPFLGYRPVARRVPKSIDANWSPRLWVFGDELGMEMRLFGDWYAVSLTSRADKALEDLRGWCGANAEGAFMITDKFLRLSDNQPAGSPQQEVKET